MDETWACLTAEYDKFGTYCACSVTNCNADGAGTFVDLAIGSEYGDAAMVTE